MTGFAALTEPLDFTPPHGEWSPTGLSNLFHGLPHLDSGFETAKNTFNPNSSSYMTSLYMIGFVIGLILLLLVLVCLIILMLIIAKKDRGYIFDNMFVLKILILTSAGFVVLALILEMALHFLMMTKMSSERIFVKEFQKDHRTYPTYASNYEENVKSLLIENTEGIKWLNRYTDNKIKSKCEYQMNEFDSIADDVPKFSTAHYKKPYFYVAKDMHNPFSKRMLGTKRRHVITRAVLWIVSLTIVLVLILLFKRKTILKVALVIVVLWLFAMIGLLTAEAMAIGDACQNPDRLAKWLDTKPETTALAMDEPEKGCAEWMNMTNSKVAELVEAFGATAKCGLNNFKLPDFFEPTWRMQHFNNMIQQNPNEKCPKPIYANALQTFDTRGTLRSFCKRDTLLAIKIAQIIASIIAAFLLILILFNFIGAKLAGWLWRCKDSRKKMKFKNDSSAYRIRHDGNVLKKEHGRKKASALKYEHRKPDHYSYKDQSSSEDQSLDVQPRRLQRTPNISRQRYPNKQSQQHLQPIYTDSIIIRPKENFIEDSIYPESAKSAYSSAYKTSYKLPHKIPIHKGVDYGSVPDSYQDNEISSSELTTGESCYAQHPHSRRYPPRAVHKKKMVYPPSRNSGIYHDQKETPSYDRDSLSSQEDRFYQNQSTPLEMRDHFNYDSSVSQDYVSNHYDEELRPAPHQQRHCRIAHTPPFYRNSATYMHPSEEKYFINHRKSSTPMYEPDFTPDYSNEHEDQENEELLSYDDGYLAGSSSHSNQHQLPMFSREYSTHQCNIGGHDSYSPECISNTHEPDLILATPDGDILYPEHMTPYYIESISSCYHIPEPSTSSSYPQLYPTNEHQHVSVPYNQRDVRNIRQATPHFEGNHSSRCPSCPFKQNKKYCQRSCRPVSYMDYRFNLKSNNAKTSIEPNRPVLLRSNSLTDASNVRHTPPFNKTAAARKLNFGAQNTGLYPSPLNMTPCTQSADPATPAFTRPPFRNQPTITTEKKRVRTVYLKLPSYIRSKEHALDDIKEEEPTS